MIIKEYNRVNRIPYIRITSDQADTYVRIAGTDDEPTNEIMIEGTDTMLQFEEVYIPPTEDLNSEQSTLPVPPA